MEDALIERVDIPTPASGEVRLKVMAAGVSFVDALTVQGGYQVKPTLPWTPGSECAGIIDAVGPEVQGLVPGDHVCALAWGDVLAEKLCVDQANVTCLPEGMPFDEGAVVRVAYMTALHALKDRAHLMPGEWLLVLGASGSMGQAAVEIGKALGAKVIAAASTVEKRRIAKDIGADHIVSSDPKHLRDEVKALVGGSAIDIIFDPVGGVASEVAFRLLNWGGRHCIVGFAAGVAKLPLNLPLVKGASVLGINVGRFTALEPIQAAKNIRQIFDLYCAGRIRPRVEYHFALDDFTEALGLAISGKAVGRIVVMP